MFRALSLSDLTMSSLKIHDVHSGSGSLLFSTPPPLYLMEVKSWVGGGGESKIPNSTLEEMCLPTV